MAITSEGNKDHDSALTLAIAGIIHCLVLPFSLADKVEFQRVIKKAKLASFSYKCPGLNAVSGRLLEFNYNNQMKATYESLKQDAHIYRGMSLW